ncbi:putative olfactory receptor 52L2 [Simochromis diagramma]|uniref:putative olfactory receptor 52L2 n=1 Tax=Simochromis diagramma TaxID=43689 RepID=UPI001A7EB073|nr:putative olfactory receptor 52L2 [Simochromis diagramma]
MENYMYNSPTLQLQELRIVRTNKSMQNTNNIFTIQLEGLNVPQEATYAMFLFLFFSYLFLIVANVGIAVLVFVDKSLHQPMYILFCNLSINDLFGNSIMIPRLLVDMLRPPSERLISYYECVVQAFTTHMFSTTAHTVLMIGLTLRLGRCRTLIKSPYCDSAALFNLSCEDVFINNVYGLTFTVLLFTGSIGSMVLTYTKITVVCLTTKNKSLNNKALKTCSTHLVVYLIFLFSGMSIITLHRFPEYSGSRKIVAVLYHIIPGSLNPIIYGMQSKEIYQKLS